MMCLIVKNQKAFKSGQFKKKLFSFDKFDPKNLPLPPSIENINDKDLYNIIPKIVEKYRKNNYITFEREELEEMKDWNDLEILLLLKFYKNSWSFEIPDGKDFFPSFTFTYNIAPLKKQIDKIVGYCYDKIEPDTSKEILQKSTSYSALEVTYLLHYFVITHPDYKDPDEKEDEF